MKTKVQVLTLVEAEARVDEGIRMNNGGDLLKGEWLLYIKENRIYASGHGKGGFRRYLLDRFDMSVGQALIFIRAFKIWKRYEVELADSDLSTACLLELERIKDDEKRWRAVKIIAKLKTPKRNTVRSIVEELLGIAPIKAKAEAEKAKAEVEAETERVEKEKREAEGFFRDAKNFRAEVQRAIEAWVGAWAAGIGIEAVKEILMDESMKVKVKKPKVA